MHSFTPDKTEPHNLFLLFHSASSRIHPPHVNTQFTHFPAGSHKSHSPGLGPGKLHMFLATMAAGKQHRATNSHLDGGWGWVIVGCCFMVTVCTRAVTRCISIFFVEFQSHFEADYSATAWVHSLVDCSTMLFAPFGSLISNRWSCRVSVILGGLLSSSGLLLSSFSTSLGLLYFSMGIMMGLGFALCYTPAIVMVGCYFRERTALAYGIGLSGSGIGTFVLAPVVQLLIDLYSWRGALLVLSAFVANLCVCGALLRPITLQNFKEEEESVEEKTTGQVPSQDVEFALKPPKEAEVSLLSLPESRRWCLDSCILSSQDYSFLLLPDFLGLALSFLLLASGCSLPFIYLVPYALGNGLSQQNAAFLMSILGVIDIVGNITFGWLTDRKCLKPYRLGCYIFSVMMEGLCCLFLTLLQTFPLLVPFAVLYGYFDGAYVALIPVVTSDLVGSQRLSSALGVAYFLHGIPYLISPPTAGWLVDVTGSYTATFFLSGGAMMASALTLAIIVGIRRCRRARLAKGAQHQPLPRSGATTSGAVDRGEQLG